MPPSSPVPPPARKHEAGPYRWATAGDINAFFGLALDNLADLVLAVSLLSTVFQYPVDFALSHFVPGTADTAGTPPPPHPPDRKGAIREQLRSPALSPTILDTSVFRGDRGRDGFFQTGFRTHPQVTA